MGRNLGKIFNMAKNVLDTEIFGQNSGETRPLDKALFRTLLGGCCRPTRHKTGGATCLLKVLLPIRAPSDRADGVVVLAG